MSTQISQTPKKRVRKSDAVTLTNGRSRDNTLTLGVNAPTPHLRLSAWGTHTAAEIFAFLPDSVRNFDVAHRLTENGLTMRAMTNLINFYRTWSKHPAPAPSIFKKAQKAMREIPGFEDWEGSKAPYGSRSNHDPTDLTLGEVRLQVERFDWKKRTIRDSIPFKDLAKDVRVYPEGEEALDLARCVRYAADHADEEWHYPQDFQELTEKLGGPVAPRLEHCDAAANHRWATIHLGDHETREWRPEDNETDEETGSDSDNSYQDLMEVEEQSSKNVSTAQQSQLSELTPRILSSQRRVLRSDNDQCLYFLPEIDQEQTLPPNGQPPEEDFPAEVFADLLETQAESSTVRLSSSPSQMIPETAHSDPVLEDIWSRPHELTTLHTSTAERLNGQFRSLHGSASQRPSTSEIWRGYSIAAMFAAEGLTDVADELSTEFMGAVVSGDNRDQRHGGR